ncbi:MAG TPA: hypothetical protein VEW28_01245 [Candidatus Kapabacteria bacterium]|nr:hypothetical protein [Candidatus Kapabacteria bacterium]
MRRIYLLVVSVALAITAAACNNGVEPFLPLVNNEMRASISDYGTFDSKPDVNTQFDGSNYILKAPILGESGSDTLVLTLVIPKRDTIPYTIAVENDAAAQIDLCVQQQSGSCINFDAKQGLGSAAITVNSITTDASGRIMQGTFSGILQPSSTPGTARTITNGEFKIILP